MSAPSPPPDHSAEVRQMELQAQRDQQERQDAKDAAHKTELSGLRSNARTAARGDTDAFFQGHGLDASTFGSQIDQRLNNILASINPSDENPGSFFKDAGQNIFNDLQTGARTSAQSQVDRLFAPNFETSREPFTIDDPFLSGIEADQRSSADAIIKNMLDRGVLTGTGAAAARSDLDRQSAGVRSKLNEFGTSVVAGGQQKLRDVANQARTAAGQVNLGQNFDANSFSNNADQVFNEFVNSLGDQIRAKVGTANLFNTTGLAALGGSAQGAGNTAFNPSAAAGNLDTTNNQSTNANSQKESIF